MPNTPNEVRPCPRAGRILLACIVCPWLLVAVYVLTHLDGEQSQRLDVNGEPLSYNAPCSTDTDCAARFGY